MNWFKDGMSVLTMLILYRLRKIKTKYVILIINNSCEELRNFDTFYLFASIPTITLTDTSYRGVITV
jgi:hypothetical protein